MFFPRSHAKYGGEESLKLDFQKFYAFNGITDSMDLSMRKLRGLVKDREFCYAAVHGLTKSWTQLNN